MQPYVRERGLSSSPTCQGIITEEFVTAGAENLTYSGVSYTFSAAGASAAGFSTTATTTSWSSASSAAGFASSAASSGFLETHEVAFSPTRLCVLNVLCLML